MHNSELFDEYLTDYQEDLKRIIGKHRRSTHYLTHDELLSEVNLTLFNSKEQLLSEWMGEFDRVAFAKIAYAYARNLIVWSHSRITKSAGVRKRVDIAHQTEDGIKSTFDFVTESLGEEDESYESFDGLDKIRHTLKIIREYAHILTERELLLLRLAEVGKNQREIAAHVGVTHQAISNLFISLSAKIKNYIKFDFYSDDSFFKVTEGQHALEYFFKHQPLPVITPEERAELFDLLTSNPKKYTLLELAAHFKNGKYTYCQLIGVCNGLGITGNLLRPNWNPYSPEEEEKLIALADEGLSVEEISQHLDRNKHSVGVKCAYLAKAGKLPKRPPVNHHPHISPAQRLEIIDLFKSGLNSAQISDKLNMDIKYVGGVRAGLTRQGLLKTTKFKTRYTPEKTKLIIDMANKGECLREIASAVGRPLQSVIRKCVYLREQSLIEAIPSVAVPKNGFCPELRDRILSFFQEGLTSRQISPQVGLSVPTLGAFRANFVRRGLLLPATVREK